MNELATIGKDNIQNKIYAIRDLQVMLDRDLAELYGVTTKRLNEQVKRNIDRFPKNFRFQMSKFEKNELVAKCDHLKNIKFSSALPYVFTEQGVAMLSSVLKSETAVKVSVNIINTFVGMRKILSYNNSLFQRLEQIEKRQISYEIASDENFEKIFKAIEDKSTKPKQGIFYDGQVYDAYIFISDLIKSAKENIIIIDSYVDDSVFTLLSKREENVEVTIYTKNITKAIKLDLNKYNAQYPNIELKKFDSSHDRFLILDNKEIYHIGASLKDLGKKWFAFSKFNVDTFDILSKLNICKT
jgi:hypothetical protein